MYIDLQKQMVLIKGIDKTSEIREVDDVVFNGKRMVTYKSGKSYKRRLAYVFEETKID